MKMVCRDVRSEFFCLILILTTETRNILEESHISVIIIDLFKFPIYVEDDRLF